MQKPITFVERLTRSIGSVPSIILHTLAFIASFCFGILGIFKWDSILLILTTVVSLEAIYLAIFIQMSVNQNTESLREVEEDVDEIQKDIDAIEEDEAEEELRDAQQKEALENIGERLQKLVDELGKLQKPD